MANRHQRCSGDLQGRPEQRGAGPQQRPPGRADRPVCRRPRSASHLGRHITVVTSQSSHHSRHITVVTSKSSHHVKSNRHIAAVTSYHITTHHITSKQSHHTKTRHPTSHNVTSHHITPHHTTSHHITSHHAGDSMRCLLIIMAALAACGAAAADLPSDTGDLLQSQLAPLGEWIGAQWDYPTLHIIIHIFHIIYLKGRRHGFLSGWTNRRQCGHLPPKYYKNRKRHRIWATSFSNLVGTSPGFQK